MSIFRIWENFDDKDNDDDEYEDDDLLEEREDEDEAWSSHEGHVKG